MTALVSRLSRAEDLSTGTWNRVAAGFEPAATAAILTDGAFATPTRALFRARFLRRATIGGTPQQIRVMAHFTGANVVANHIQK
jgi:hypothetical protein